MRAGPLGLLLAFCGTASCALASPVTPGTLEFSTTSQSIGLEWEVNGDTDHDAVCDIQYRTAGEATWRPAMSLVRVNSANGNTLAGSILFAAANTEYEVQLSLSDPDGGADMRTINVRTKNMHTAPTPLRTLHVVPGSSGGDGSAGNPYRGLATAWAQAQAGDELLLHTGHYGAVNDDSGQSGTAANPIIIRDADDGEVVLSYLQVFQRSNLWIEGLTFRFDGSSDTGFYASLLNAGYDNGFQAMLTDVDNIALVRNRFEGFKHGIRAGPRTTGWYIADNTIIGDKQLGATGTLSWDGEGIELGHGSDHEVAHNSITLVADGISFPERNCDIYGNDIFDTTDDGIELDGGQANTRVWQNRIHNASNNGIAFQPQSGAPWYIIRNQVVNSQESIFKFRDGDRFVAVHNTFVNYNEVLDHWSHQLLRGITRNNLWISVNNGPIWRRSEEEMSWRTDLDYDGFDWGSNSAPFEINGTEYRDLAELQAASGQLANGIEIDANTCLESFDVPGPPPLISVPAQYMTLTASCDAVDAGVVIPNISDTFEGAAPDMGAYERGTPDPHYGPRAAQPTPTNRAPIANAGADQIAEESTGIMLSGAGSTDPDGDPLDYLWTQLSGPAVSIPNPAQQSVSVVLPSVNATEVLVFELTVSDPSGASSTDAISVTVNNVVNQNTVPVANAGGDRTGDEGARLSLSGAASSDADGDPLSFSWRQTSGPAATFSSSQAMTTDLTLPQVSATTMLTIELTVTDSAGASATDTMSITLNDVSSTSPTNPSQTSGGSGTIDLLWLIALSGLAGLRSSTRRQPG